ncbi:Ig-like domain-containing protein [Polaribacter sp. Z014]|uniref:Ig-like domain-containing protein n=1 Tax=unclassified Polaribacter TaxID=196858 RepID=UPI00193C72EF|nr:MULTISPECIES: Ig-like domain-containing protein [unclassified Polaribacter]MCL7764750.1 Ig-like domain-containing protein [Polaribacter sp. Z014]QVY64059.1 Ig domain-containing protein [Polaribacter sp. Q13]
MRYLQFILFLSLTFNSCIEDDIIADNQIEILSFNNTITELGIKNTHLYSTKYTNNIGEVTTPKINWDSSNSNIISVSNAGLLTALSIGESVITASVTNENGSIITNENNIEVIAVDKKLTIDNVIEEIIISNTHQYTASFTNELGEIEDLKTSWNSSNPSIITVSNEGLITALSEGSATVTASITTANGEIINTEDTVTVVNINERISINNPIEELNINNTHQYTTTYTNSSGETENTTITWQSSNTNVITVTNTGLITAIAPGEAVITATVSSSNNTLTIQDTVTVIGNTTQEKTGTLKTSSSYELKGGFTLKEIPNTNDLELTIDENYKASDRLPGLYLYFTNNINTVANAKEIEKVTVFKGAHTYIIKNTGINDFSHLLYWCKPFGVDVGNGEIK